jgi:hypothetical protein
MPRPRAKRPAKGIRSASGAIIWTTWGKTLDRLETAQPEAFAAFLVYEEQRRAALQTGPAASGVSRDLLAKFTGREQRLARFREFLNERHKAGGRLPGILSFWEWDGALNPGPFERQAGQVEEQR